MQTTVEFESRLFIPFLPDDVQVNPGIFGAELAWWLSRQLMRRGVATSYPGSEDWGWYVEYISKEGDKYLLCCANCDATEDRWQCRLQPQARNIFSRKPSVEGARPLMLALQGVLADEPCIGNVSWA